jgi:hypothetical protein
MFSCRSHGADIASISKLYLPRRILRHAWPFTERQIGCCDDDRRALVEPADEVEQELAAGLSERQLTELVEEAQQPLPDDPKKD